MGFRLVVVGLVLRWMPLAVVLVQVGPLATHRNMHCIVTAFCRRILVHS